MIWRDRFSTEGGEIDVDRERELRLVAQARAGAAWAVSALVARYQPPVVRYLVRLTGDPTRARELAESIFVRMAKRVRGPHGGEHLRLWLLRAATDAGLDVLRHPDRAQPARLAAPAGPAGLLAGRGGGRSGRGRAPNASRPAPRTQQFIWQAPESPTPDGRAADGLEAAEWQHLSPREALRHRLVRAVLAELPYGDAQCLALHLVAGLNQSEVAAAVGLAAPVARRRVVQGLQLFGRRYEAAAASLGLPPEFSAPAASDAATPDEALMPWQDVPDTLVASAEPEPAAAPPASLVPPASAAAPIDAAPAGALPIPASALATSEDEAPPLEVSDVMDTPEAATTDAPLADRVAVPPAHAAAGAASVDAGDAAAPEATADPADWDLIWPPRATPRLADPDPALVVEADPAPPEPLDLYASVLDDPLAATLDAEPTEEEPPSASVQAWLGSLDVRGAWLLAAPPDAGTTAAALDALDALDPDVPATPDLALPPAPDDDGVAASEPVLVTASEARDLGEDVRADEDHYVLVVEAEPHEETAHSRWQSASAWAARRARVLSADGEAEDPIDAPFGWPAR
jgi:DNA-directed RNA polymerase specialized sigma24 family protein